MWLYRYLTLVFGHQIVLQEFQRAEKMPHYSQHQTAILTIFFFFFFFLFFFFLFCFWFFFFFFFFSFFFSFFPLFFSFFFFFLFFIFFTDLAHKWHKVSCYKISPVWCMNCRFQAPPFLDTILSFFCTCSATIWALPH